jgi:hypothetical protein
MTRMVSVLLFTNPLKIETPSKPKERRQIVFWPEKEEKRGKIKWF